MQTCSSRCDMRLGLMLGYWMPDPWDPTDLVLEAERLGYDSAWTAEAYGSDVFSPLCWIGARTSRIKLGTGIMQISARTPACVAMTVATIDHLSARRPADPRDRRVRPAGRRGLVRAAVPAADGTDARVRPAAPHDASPRGPGRLRRRALPAAAPRRRAAREGAQADRPPAPKRRPDL